METTKPLQPADLSSLAQAPLFKGLEPEALRAIAGVARRLTLRAGERLFFQERPADALYVLLSGRVKLVQTTVEGQAVVLRLFGPGELLGLVSTLEGSSYPATAVAVESSSAVRWPGRVLHQLMQAHPRLALNALPVLVERLHEVQERFREMATERVERRIARALLRLVGQTGRKVEGGVRIGVPLSRQDLAEMTGTTLFTVSRVLRRWEQEGLLSSGRRQLTIRQPHALVAIAEEFTPAGP